MNKNIIITVLTLIITIFLFLFLKNNKVIVQENPPIVNINATNTPVVVNTSTTTTSENMDLVVYIQDKEAAKISDCSVTVKRTYQIPKTEGVADASLKILFSDELKAYGIYKSVSIENSVAKIVLESDKTPQGKPTGSLSSCENGHLLSVLTDTLTQYNNVKSVKLYSPKGEIVF